MKSLKQIGFIAVTIFFFASCTMEKRVYTSGYHIEWLDGKQNLNKSELANEEHSKKPIENKVIVSNQAEQPTLKTDETVTASADHSTFIPSTPKINLHQHKNNILLNENATTSEIKTVAKAETKQIQKTSKKSGGDTPKGLLYVLCFIIPVIAVGLATDWDTQKMIYNFLWCLLCGVPGIIHAIMIVSKSK